VTTGADAPLGTVPTVVVPGCSVRASRPAVIRYDAVVAEAPVVASAVVSLTSVPSQP